MKAEREIQDAPKSNARTKASANLSQKEIPSVSLDQALRLPKAIADNYGYEPTSPLMVAKAMGNQPLSGPFRMLCGASVAYGLTEGGYNAEQIKITPLGLCILRPTSDGEDDVARKQAVTTPRVMGTFLKKYDGSLLPREQIAKNVLNDMGVPLRRAADALKVIMKCAEEVGFIQDINGKKYVHMAGAPTPTQGKREAEKTLDSGAKENGQPISQEVVQTEKLGPELSAGDAARKKRVYITHGKDKSHIETIQKLLKFGEMEGVLSVERQTVSQPVPDKVMNDMRACGAAIIHVDAEVKLVDSGGKEHSFLNPNVLIEIGAAMALYGRRFILLVREGISLPSNLQGLYEVRYTGDSLDGNVTIKLLEAINDIKNHSLPSQAPPAR